MLSDWLNWINVVGSLVTVFAAGFAVAWLISSRGAGIEHRHRLFEEHTKRFMADNYECYYPYWVWAETVYKRLQENSRDDKSCFFALAQFLSVGELWQKKIGGVFFLGDRVAESLFAALDFEVSKVLRHMLGKRENLYKIITHTPVNADFTEWLPKIESGGALHDIFTHTFQPWCRNGDFDHLVIPLRCAAAVLSFEINYFTSPIYRGKKPTKPAIIREYRNFVEGKLNELENKQDIERHDKEEYMGKIGLPLC